MAAFGLIIDEGVEDELDAFNDETFGSADQWQESEHENLAQLTEQVDA